MSKRIFSKRAKSVLFSSLGITSVIGAIPVGSALILNKLNAESGLKLANNQDLSKQISVKTAPNYGRISFDHWMQLKDYDASGKKWSSLQQSSPFTMSRTLNNGSTQNVPNTRALIGTNSGIITYKQKQGLFKIPYDGSEVVPGNGIHTNFKNDFTTNLDYVWQMQYMPDADIVVVLSSTTSVNRNLRLSIWKSDNMKFLGAQDVSFANFHYEPNPDKAIFALVPLFDNVHNKFVIYSQNRSFNNYNTGSSAHLLVAEISVSGHSNSIKITKVNNNANVFNNAGIIISSAFYGLSKQNELQAVSVVANKTQNKMEVINYKVALDNGKGTSSVISSHDLLDKGGKNTVYYTVNGLDYGRIPSNGIINDSDDKKHKQIIFQIMGNYDQTNDKFAKFAHLCVTLEKDPKDNTKWIIKSSNSKDTKNGSIGFIDRNQKPDSVWWNRSNFLENKSNDTTGFGPGAMTPRFIVANSNTKIFYGISNTWKYVNSTNSSYNNSSFLINAASYNKDPVDELLVKSFHKGPNATGYEITNQENKYFLVPDVSPSSTEMPQLGFIEINDQKRNGIPQNRLIYHKTNMSVEFAKRTKDSNVLVDKKIFPHVQGKADLFNDETKVIPLSEISNATNPHTIADIDFDKLKNQIAFCSEKTMITFDYELTNNPGTLKLNIFAKGTYNSTENKQNPNQRIWDGFELKLNKQVNLGFIMVSGFDSILDISTTKPWDMFEFNQNIKFDSWNWNLSTSPITLPTHGIPENIVKKLVLKWQIKNNNHQDPLMLNNQSWYSADELQKSTYSTIIKNYMDDWNVVVKFKLDFKNSSDSQRIKIDSNEYIVMKAIDSASSLNYDFTNANKLKPKSNLKFIYNVNNENEAFKKAFPLKFWAEENITKTKVSFDTTKHNLVDIIKKLKSYWISSISVAEKNNQFDWTQWSQKIELTDMTSKGKIVDFSSCINTKTRAFVLRYNMIDSKTKPISNGEIKFSTPLDNGPNWITTDYKVGEPINFVNETKYDGTSFGVTLTGTTADLKVSLTYGPTADVWKNILEAKFQANFLGQNWYNSTEFNAEIVKKYNANNGLGGWIKLTDLDIRMKLVLKPNLPNDGKKYKWTDTVQEIITDGKQGPNINVNLYNTQRDVKSKINTTNWKSKFNFTVNGKTDSSVTLGYGAGSETINFDNYKNQGVQLQYSFDKKTWITLNALPKTNIKASGKIKMYLQLVVIPANNSQVSLSDPILLEIPIKAKKEIALNSSEFKNKITITGTTHNPTITIDPTIYNPTNNPNIENEIRSQLELRFWINTNETDPKKWLNTEKFKTYLGSLSNSDLNNLNPTNFGVAWFFIEGKAQTLYSNEIFNSSNYNKSTNRSFNVGQLKKTIDLSDEINKIKSLKLTGPSTNITWGRFKQLFSSFSLSNGAYVNRTLDVKMQFAYFKTSTKPGLSFEWSGFQDEQPKSVATVKTVDDTFNPNHKFPIAISFVPINQSVKIDLKNIVKNVANEIDLTKGYKVDTTNIANTIDLSNFVIGANYQAQGTKGILNDKNHLNFTVKKINLNESVEKYLKVQFAFGNTKDNPIELKTGTSWFDANPLSRDLKKTTKFDIALQNYLAQHNTNQIKFTDIIIHMRLALINGNEADKVEDSLIRYNKVSQTVYNGANAAGTEVVKEFNATPQGSVIKAYYIPDANWFKGISITGKKETEVSVHQDTTINHLDLNELNNWKIKLEYQINGTWTPISKFGPEGGIFSVAGMKTVKIRLHVQDTKNYTFYSTNTSIFPSTASNYSDATKTAEASIFAKTLVSDLNLQNLQQVEATGTTHQIDFKFVGNIFTSKDIEGNFQDYIVPVFRINKDSTKWYQTEEFKTYLGTLRGDNLNNLVPTDFQIAYFFTENGLKKYYSDKVINDPSVNPNNINNLFKSFTVTAKHSRDLSDAQKAVATYKVSGQTDNLNFSAIDKNNILYPTTFTTKFKGLKIQYGIYKKNNSTNWAYQWLDERPKQLETKDDPKPNDGMFPFAIRFSVANNKFDYLSPMRFDKNDQAILLETEPNGYEVILKNVTQKIDVGIAFNELSNLNLSGTIGQTNLNINESIVLDKINNLFKDKVEIQYQLSNGYYQAENKEGLLDNTKWFNFANLKTNLEFYIQDYAGQNSNLAILALSNDKNLTGLKINAKLVSKNPNYSVSIIDSKPINTNQTKVKFDLTEYIAFLQKIELAATGTSVLQPGIISIKEQMIESSTGFLKNRDFSEIKTALDKVGIKISFKGKNPANWVDDLKLITGLENDASLEMKFSWTNTGIEVSGTTSDAIIKLKVKVPKNIDISSTIINKVQLSGNTKHLIIDETKIKSDPSFSNNPYKAVVTIEYAIGTTESETDLLALSTTEPTKKWFTQIEFTNALKNYNQDITQAQKNIFARFALIKGTVSQDYLFSDNKVQKINQMNTINIFAHDKGRFNLLKKIKISGSADNLIFKFPPELNSISNNSDPGLQFVWTTDPNAKVADIYNNPSKLWTETRPTKLDAATNHYLAIAIKSKSGYVYEKEYPNQENNQLQQLDTTDIFTLINLQNLWLQDVAFTGNTSATSIDETTATNHFQTLNGANEIVIQYSYDQKNWFAKDAFINKLKAQNGAQDVQNFILLKDDIKARYSLTANGFNKYRLIIDGIKVPTQFPTTTNLFQDVIKNNPKNNAYQGYINLNLINDVFNKNSFLITGTTENWKIEIKNESLITKFAPYQKAQAKVFDIYYTTTKGADNKAQYTFDEGHKVFGENGFMKPTILDKIDFSKFFSLLFVPVDGYKLSENNRPDLSTQSPAKDYFEIADIPTDLIVIVDSPLSKKSSLSFSGYQGDGKILIKNSSKLEPTVEKSIFTILDEYADPKNPALFPLKNNYKVQLYISDTSLSPTEIENIKLSDEGWVDVTTEATLPQNFKVGQWVIARVKSKYEKLVIKNIDLATSDITEVKGLNVHMNQIQISDKISYSNWMNASINDSVDGDTYIKLASVLKDNNNDNNDNYRGVKLVLETNLQYYYQNKKIAINPITGSPLTKREKSAKSINLNMKDDSGQNIVVYTDNNNKPTKPLVEQGDKWVQIPLTRSSDTLNDNTFSFESFDDYKGFLFNNQKFRIRALIDENFVDDKTSDGTNLVKEFSITNAKYPILTQNSTEVVIDNSTVTNVKYKSDSYAEPRDGAAYVSSGISLKFMSNDEIRVLKNEEALAELKKISSNSLTVNISYVGVKGNFTDLSDTINISQLKNLRNGDRITISIVSKDKDFVYAQSDDAIIVVKDLIIEGPPGKDLYNLRILENQKLNTENGKGAFRMTLDTKATLNNIVDDKTSEMLSNNFAFKYRVWDENKEIVDRPENDIKGWNENYPQGLKNGQRIEWKLVSLGIGAEGGDIGKDYYNTIPVRDKSGKLNYWEILVDSEGTHLLKKGIGEYSYANDNKEYPESGFTFTDLYETVQISKEDAQLISEIKLEFSGTNGSGRFHISDSIQEKIDDLLQNSGIKISFSLNGREITQKSPILTNNDQILISYKYVGKTGEKFKNVTLVGDYKSEIQIVKNLTIPNNLASQIWTITGGIAGGFLILTLAAVIIYKRSRNKKINIK